MLIKTNQHAITAKSKISSKPLYHWFFGRPSVGDAESHFSLKDNVTGSDTLYDVHACTVLPKRLRSSHSQLCSSL